MNYSYEKKKREKDPKNGFRKKFENVDFGAKHDLFTPL